MASGDAAVVSFRSGTQIISRLVKAGGAVGAIIRDKEAALLGIPSSMISLDVRDAVLPGTLAAAFLICQRDDVVYRRAICQPA